LRGVQVKYLQTNQLLLRHLLIYGLGGIIAPLFAIKFIDMLIATTGWG
jgi:K+-transporting ATPase ATPase B chain